MALANCLGLSVSETWEAILAGATGLKPQAHDSAVAYAGVAGAVGLPSVPSELGLPRQGRGELS